MNERMEFKKKKKEKKVHSKKFKNLSRRCHEEERSEKKRAHQIKKKREREKEKNIEKKCRHTSPDTKCRKEEVKSGKERWGWGHHIVYM